MLQKCVPHKTLKFEKNLYLFGSLLIAYYLKTDTLTDKC